MVSFTTVTFKRVHLALSLVHRASRKVAVTLDSTFLFKTASNTQEALLTAEQLIKYKTNYRVRKLEQNNPRNHTGKDLLIYCDNDYRRLNIGSILVCLWNDHWHKIARPDHPILGEEIPWLHTYDGNRPMLRTSTPQPDKGKETTSEQSIDDSDQKALNDQIRNSPTVTQQNLPAPTPSSPKRSSAKYYPPTMVTQTSTEIEEKLGPRGGRCWEVLLDDSGAVSYLI